MIEIPLKDNKNEVKQTEKILFCALKNFIPLVTSIIPLKKASDKFGKCIKSNSLLSGNESVLIIPVFDSMSENKKKIVMYPPTSKTFETVSFIVEARRLSIFVGVLNGVVTKPCFFLLPENIMPHITLDKIWQK